MTWAVAAAQFGAAGLNLFSEFEAARTDRTTSRIVGGLERRQIAMQSRMDAEARIRQTGSLVSSQRAALASSGVAGGRTSRLLEANARIAASRQQAQADKSAILARTSTRLQEIQARSQGRRRVLAAGVNLLSTGADFAAWQQQQPGDLD